MKKEIKMKAKGELLGSLLEEIKVLLVQFKWDNSKIVTINICVEEIFVNVANYAYGDEEGDVIVQLEVDENQAKFTFIDSGVQYNPLAKPDPDITLSASERQIGGLGIYMVKNMMNDVSYEYVDNTNRFTMILNA